MVGSPSKHAEETGAAGGEGLAGGAGDTVREGAGGDEESKTQARYSIAYFFHPCRDTALVSVPSERVRQRAEGQAGGRVVTAIEHLNGRLAATYGWGTAEVAAGS